MYPIDLGHLASVIGGKLIRGTPQTPVKHVLYEFPKHLESGVVFIINPGRSLSRQLHELQRKASAGIVAPKGLEHRIPSRHPLISVRDTKQALWRLLHWQRSRSNAIFIGITGSSGKTTTKEMAAAVLMRRFRTLKSRDNLNVARTIHHHLLRLNPSQKAIVLEMGMSRLGDIRKQCQVAKPSIGIVTCVKEAHVGSLGSSLHNVVRAKQELIDGVSPNGLLIVNGDDDGVRKLNTKGRHTWTFGIKQRATVQATNVRYSKGGMGFHVRGVPYQIPTWGVHNVYNALAAIAVGFLLKVPVSNIQKALRTFPVPKMRLQKIGGRRGRLLINDAYNANPSSTMAGLEVLQQVAGSGHSVAVLGDMHELGKLTAQGHRNVGIKVAQTRPSFLVTVGPRAAQIGVAARIAGYPANQILTCANRPLAIANFLHTKMPANSVFYFKASRIMELEHIVRPLRAK
ncbi:UDP-N-acetylmuramoyl-tripeptide--D-alanyl-D-alanine ligase [Marininema mesophilum]|uniref:UDP-N-acetylmuramoyl-tripeptide--D-alanyl-D-alanine ligase n=1 Tax=Marininema mesophilum TaxID=1048340 RepID=A0A1H2W4S4_9BACL|nr:UDP-N-acetylmuramoyl-tripeptide--D-alanyl-D-alanine ligase [Marininema mesophilum]SDW75547.1 UDP-N-acetylmuramoyl-tripeptide--D-alanyl-D-alanine ligase [Marininema mesophilum]